jgi:hypothetical protein
MLKFIHCHASLGFHMGTGIPAVFRKRVIQVRVRCCKLPTPMITVPIPAVSQVFTVFFSLTGKIFIIILNTTLPGGEN